VLYDAQLVQKGIPKNFRFYYKKWLRYYLDFCQKYNFKQSDKESLSYFIKKLKEKNQTDQQQKQASHAISIYYEILSADRKKEIPFNHKKKILSSKKEYLKPTNADWRPIYSDLNAEIKLRHYSPKTFQSYRGWVRQLQGFTRSKDPQLLSSADIKDFLTFLAVKREVAASTQNQAFNALLFFFRHILKKEFGEIKDIPRAKRKPYIPTVLSREDFDAIITRLSALIRKFDGVFFYIVSPPASLETQRSQS